MYTRAYMRVSMWVCACGYIYIYIEIPTCIHEHGNRRSGVESGKLKQCSLDATYVGVNLYLSLRLFAFFLCSGRIISS